MGRVTLTQGPDSSSKGAPGTRKGAGTRFPRKEPVSMALPPPLRHPPARRGPEAPQKERWEAGVCAGPGTKPRRGGGGGSADSCRGSLPPRLVGSQRERRPRSQGPSQICIIRAFSEMPHFSSPSKTFAQAEPVALAWRDSTQRFSGPVHTPGCGLLVGSALRHPRSPLPCLCRQAGAHSSVKCSSRCSGCGRALLGPG